MTKNLRITLGLALVAVYVGTIVLANYVTTEYGMVSVGFGLMATAGTYLIGVLLVVRDSLQDVAGKAAVFGAIAVGALASYLVADPFIATASVCAFALAETVDFLIYTPLRPHGYVRAALASNVVGAIVDTFVFLSVAGFPLTRDGITGQLLGKLAITAAVLGILYVFRAHRRAAMV